MHGCIRRAHLAFIFTLLTAGCTDSLAPATPQAADCSAYGVAYNQSATGTITGTVHWRGDLPQAPPFKIFGLPGDYPVDVRKDQPNPNLPRIEPKSLAMEDVVVFLREIDLKKSKPWDQPKARIELRDRHVHIDQGKSSSNVGWARVGDTVEIVNRDEHFHMLRGRGAAFFSLPFAALTGPSSRRLDKPGIVELSSGSFFFWMHGYLLVTDHPYYARTDASGRFVLDNVPAGSYELVCWMPNWRVAKRNRDPETGLIIQVDFEPPVEQIKSVDVHTGQDQEASFTWTMQNFGP